MRRVINRKKNTKMPTVNKLVVKDDLVLINGLHLVAKVMIWDSKEDRELNTYRFYCKYTKYHQDAEVVCYRVHEDRWYHEKERIFVGNVNKAINSLAATIFGDNYNEIREVLPIAIMTVFRNTFHEPIYKRYAMGIYKISDKK